MSGLWTNLIGAVGGIGVFLIGMLIMTEGLKQITAKPLRSYLVNYTKSPLSGSIFGALSTSILQSSSAVTVATVGFVSAGMMTFSHSLGVIFGANVGTTITGWLVFLFGFKLKLGLATYLLIFIGALMRLFSRTIGSSIGYAIAGFGIVFLGLNILQQSMAEMSQYFDFGQLALDSVTDRIIVLGVGILFTVITQSSSAGVAATLTAMTSGLIQFEQAALLVIGFDIGTTFTALLATLGASVNAKRTGYSHVIYNIITGIFSVILIYPFVYVWEQVSHHAIIDNGEIALVTFHTLFNVLGVVLILPFTQAFSSLIIRLFPDSQHRELDEQQLKHPTTALVLSTQELVCHFQTLLNKTLTILNTPHPWNTAQWSSLDAELDILEEFIDRIELEANNSSQIKQLIELIHALDHIRRLKERCMDSDFVATCMQHSSRSVQLAEHLNESIKHILTCINTKSWTKLHEYSAAFLHEYEANHSPFRQSTMGLVALEKFDIPTASAVLEGYRWLIHVSRHISRCSSHLAQASLMMARTD